VRRVAVIGPVGAGKSTFARALALRTGLPLVVLDDVYWRDGRRPPPEEWEVTHAAIVAADDWVVDGDYRAVAGRRLARADVIVWLDPSLALRTWRVLWRAGRPGSPPVRDCLRWTWRYPRHGRPETLAMLEHVPAGTRVYRLRSRRAVRAFLATAPTGFRGANASL
jgi:hypothetical protein